MSEKITIHDLVTYHYVENLQYSPDGKTLAWQVAYADEKKNTYKRDVWMLRDGKPVQLTSTLNASIVCWEDDNTLLLQRSTEDTAALTTDLYRIHLDGGEAVRAFTLPFAMSSMKKVKDGVYAALGTIDMHNPDVYLLDEEGRKKYADEQKEEHENYQVVDEVPYWFNGQNFVNGNRTALFLIELNPFGVKRLTAPAFDTDAMLVDGERIIYSGNERTRRQSLYNRVYAYDVKTGKTETIYGKDGMSFNNLFVLNGKLYGQACDLKEYGVNETGKVSRIEKDKLEVIFKPEISLYDSVVGDTTLGGGRESVSVRNHWITIATKDYYTVLLDFDKKFSRKEISTQGINAYCLAANEDQIAFAGQDWNHLSEVYVMDRDGSGLKRVTAYNDEALKDKYIAQPQKLAYTSQGEVLNGWVLLPKGYNEKKKYPAVFDIHGGPRCVYGEMFFHEMQAWASEGYFVFYTNIRGSDGRGDAFADIRGKYGEVDYQNLMDFMDAVLKKYPAIDPKRVCETGGSYGGFMTNWIITHTDLFCAAASQRSISNWVSMSFISDIGPYFGADQNAAKTPFEYDKLWEHSPLKYAENVKTPTLFIHSDEDRRCPLPEGMQMMQALAVRNVETRMCIFHGETHELSRSGKPLHRIRRMQEITDWFNAHTGNGRKDKKAKSTKK